jgi:hypothetical protein
MTAIELSKQREIDIIEHSRKQTELVTQRLQELQQKRDME